MSSGKPAGRGAVSNSILAAICAALAGGTATPAKAATNRAIPVERRRNFIGNPLCGNCKVADVTAEVIEARHHDNTSDTVSRLRRVRFPRYD
jgi:hypothetical protein